VVVTGEKLELADKVFFDSGKATIQDRSHALLDEVAKVLTDHPEVKRVLIEGHTDSVGSAARNTKLSQARAESVRKYLVGRGVATDRLEAKGFGSARPVADNKTVAGREENRRVEFRIQ
jgi:outer membrane protein OmpA-like peptidoglycan-associated protein